MSAMRTGPRLKQIQLTEDEARALTVSASKLERVLEASKTFVGDAVEPPVPGSRIDHAYQTDLREPFDQAGLLIYAAEDHYRTILQLVKTGPLPSFALFTLLRAAGEATVRCRHLLDPGISETDRLGRALNERLDNLQEQRKVRPHDADQQPQYVERVRHLEERATANGVPVLRSKSGSPRKIIGFAETVKNDIDLFELYLTAGTVFRFLSGYVHSKQWVQAPRNRAESTDEPGVSLVGTDLDVVLFAGLLDLFVTLHDENIGFWLILAGYPSEVWRSAKAG